MQGFTSIESRPLYQVSGLGLLFLGVSIAVPIGLPAPGINVPAVAVGPSETSVGTVLAASISVVLPLSNTGVGGISTVTLSWVVHISGVILAVPHPYVHQRLGVGNLYRPTSPNTDRLQVLRAKDAAETRVAGAIAAVMHQSANSTQPLPHRTTGGHRRILGGIPIPIAELIPFLTKSALTLYSPPDLLLGSIGIQPPYACGVLDLHRVIDDVEPDRCGCLAGNGYSVPAGARHLSGETPAKAAPAIEFERFVIIGIVANGADSLDLCSPPYGCGVCPRERANHQADNIPRVIGTYGYVLTLIPKDFEAKPVSASPGQI